MKMSTDPYLFNDQLKNSAIPPVGWNDVPVLFQKEIFEHLGCLRRVYCQRVCRSWKILLKNWSHIVLVDKIPIHSLELYKGFREYLADAARNSRFLLFDLSRHESARDGFRIQLAFVATYDPDILPTVITTEGNLEHVILTGGKMCPDFYFAFLKFFKLDREQRPVQFSLANCTMVCTINAFLDNTNKYQLFSKEFVGFPLPKLSVRCAANDDIVYRLLLSTFRKVLLPYTLNQITWLKNCIERAVAQEHEFLTREFGPSFGKLCNRYLNCCSIVVYASCQQMKPDFRFNYYSASSTVMYEQKIAVVISYFARKISAGELNLPPPPEPVFLCPLHTNSAICSCSAIVGDISAPFNEHHS